MRHKRTPQRLSIHEHFLFPLPPDRLIQTENHGVRVTLPYLPPEIKSDIASHLSKFDLKQLRFVSKEWSTSAAPFLFHRVFLSTRRTDILVFQNLANHSEVRHYVGDLVYDATNCFEMSLREYSHEMMEQLRSMTRNWHQQGANKLFNSVHPGLNAMIKTFQRRDNGEYITSDLMSKFFIVDGYRNWQRQANEQRQSFCIHSDNFLPKKISQSLSQLTNLRTVFVDDFMGRYYRCHLECATRSDANEFLHYRATEGSPFARSWDVLHLLPQELGEPPIIGHRHTLSDHAGLIIHSLSLAKIHVKSFRCAHHNRYGLSPDFFLNRTSIGPKDNIQSPMTNALHLLEKLELKITPKPRNIVHLPTCATLGFLPHLLRQMHNLRFLDLQLLNDKRLGNWKTMNSRSFVDPCYNYSQIIPREGRWSNLKFFSVGGLALDGLDLVYIVSAQMPDLTHLFLERIDLLHGHWAAVIEAMRLRGQWLGFGLASVLRHYDQWWPVMPDPKKSTVSYMRKMSDYVVQGGLHPCLNRETLSGESLHDLLQEIYLGASQESRDAFARYKLESTP